MPLAVELDKPRLLFDARDLNGVIKDKPFPMDIVARVAQVASQGCYMTSLDDASAFHHILLRPSSWPLFGFAYEGVDYCWRVLPFWVLLGPVGIPHLERGKSGVPSRQRDASFGVRRRLLFQ